MIMLATSNKSRETSRSRHHIVKDRESQPTYTNSGAERCSARGWVSATATRASLG
jgi:hypothetical protein